MDSYAALWHHDVMSHKALTPGEINRSAVHMKSLVWEIPAQRGIGKQVTETTLDIHPAVCPGCAGAIADLIKFFFSFG